MLYTIRIFLGRKDVQIIIIRTSIGAVLQFAARNFIKNHPEFLEDVPEPKKNYKRPKFLFTRGGGPLVRYGAKVLTKVIVQFIAKKELMAGLVTGDSVFISKIPSHAISTYLYDAMITIPESEKKRYILVGKKKLYFDQCDQNLKYLFQILEDPIIPFEEKEKVASLVLRINIL